MSSHCTVTSVLLQSQTYTSVSALVIKILSLARRTPALGWNYARVKYTSFFDIVMILGETSQPVLGRGAPDN